MTILGTGTVLMAGEFFCSRSRSPLFSLVRVGSRLWNERTNER